MAPSCSGEGRPGTVCGSVPGLSPCAPGAQGWAGSLLVPVFSAVPLPRGCAALPGEASLWLPGPPQEAPSWPHCGSGLRCLRQQRHHLASGGPAGVSRLQGLPHLEGEWCPARPGPWRQCSCPMPGWGCSERTVLPRGVGGSRWPGPSSQGRPWVSADRAGQCRAEGESRLGPCPGCHSEWPQLT